MMQELLLRLARREPSERALLEMPTVYSLVPVT